MRFLNPEYFQWFLLLPVLIVIYIAGRRYYSGQLKKAFGAKLSPLLTSSVSVSKLHIKFCLEILVLTFLIFSLSRPQAGLTLQKERSQGVEIMIIADVSPSMLAEDVKPSRLGMLKANLKKFIADSPGDRIGIVGLSGSAVLICPLTNDKAALEMYIESLSADSVSTRGTDQRQGFETALRALQRGSSTDSEEAETTSVTSQVVLLASDGESHEPGADKAVQELRKKGARLFTLTFGTEKGGFIPLRDERGYLRKYKQDRQGSDVVTTAHYADMQKLAELGGGRAYAADFQGVSLRDLRTDLGKLEQGEFDSRVSQTFDERFQIPLLIATLLALIELAIGLRRKARTQWRGRFEAQR